MAKLLVDYPGARRALFARYHIGGCSSCAYADDEALAQVCERNELEVAEVISHILESDEHDRAMLISPLEVESLLKSNAAVILLDIRTREEHEAVAIKGSEFLTQERQQELFGTAGQESIIILYDHNGAKSLDTCSWFQGHGLKGTRAMRGGIDGWSQQVDKSLPRYRLELD